MYKLRGLDRVVRNLNKAIDQIEKKTLKGLIRASIVIRRSMDKQYPKIPVDTGNLRSSYYCVSHKSEVVQGRNPRFKRVNLTTDNKARLEQEHARAVAVALSDAKRYKYPVVILGFSAWYAWTVHERMGVNYQRPQAGPKFFQMAIKNNMDKILKIIEEEAKV